MEEKAFRCQRCKQKIIKKYLNKNRLPRYCSPACYQESRKNIPEYIQDEVTQIAEDNPEFCINIKIKTWIGAIILIMLCSIYCML